MRALTHKANLFLIALAIIGMAVTSCSPFTKTQKGAAIGAGAGGTVGALIGHAAGNTALGAIIGGAVGGTAGAYIGSKMDKQATDLRKAVPNATVTRTAEGIIIKFNSGILFDNDMTDLKPEAVANLKSLALSLQNSPQTNITIKGHTDSLGTPAHNMDLSLKRAEAVKTCLVSSGIDSTHVTAIGKGDTEPIASNATPAGRAQNRRVEIIIVPNDQMKNQDAKNNP